MHPGKDSLLGKIPCQFRFCVWVVGARRVRGYHPPKARPPVTMIQGDPAQAVAELVHRLRDEAKVI